MQQTRQQSFNHLPLLRALQLMKKRTRTAKKRPDSSILLALAVRLREAMGNLDVQELAAKVGVTRVTLYRWLSAKFDPGVAKLCELAEALDISPAWLITGQEPKNRRRALYQARLADYALPEFDTFRSSFSQSPIAFLQSWSFELLYGPIGKSGSNISASPAPPWMLEVHDDSMEPTIKQGALVLVDRSFSRPPMKSAPPGATIWDGIYCFRPLSRTKDAETATVPMIRRVRYFADGKMGVRCDNPKYPREEVYDRNRPRPIGRVVWHAHRT